MRELPHDGETDSMVRGKKPGTFYFFKVGVVYARRAHVERPPFQRGGSVSKGDQNHGEERVTDGQKDARVVLRLQAAGRTLTVRRTVAPSRASISMSASVLKRSIRPRRRSLTRG